MRVNRRLMPPSTYCPPAPLMMDSIRRVVCGETALQSAYTACLPVERIAEATCSATETAWSGTSMERMRSACSTRSPREGMSRKCAWAASWRVRSLLPRRQVITSISFCPSAYPTPDPMSPGLSIATVWTDIERLSLLRGFAVRARMGNSALLKFRIPENRVFVAARNSIDVQDGEDGELHGKGASGGGCAKGGLIL